MPRPPHDRFIHALPMASVFKPAGVPARHLERVVLALDELEALRLVDLHGRSHEQAAGSMGVSRQTVGRIVESGRRKVADALLHGKALEIDGGPYRLAGRQDACCGRGSDSNPTREGRTMSAETTTTRRVAVPSEHPGGLEARRSGHFGRCDCFTVVDVVDGAIGEVEVIANPPHTEGGCMAPVLLLGENQVDAIVVDGIGGRPLQGFLQVGIAVHAGIGPDVATAVRAYASGQLPVVGPDRVCQH